jgi:hypothetical protein
MKLAATASRRERALVANSSENRTVLEANVGSATPVPRTGVAASEMKGLQPGSYFAGDSLEISSSRPPPIAADYLPSARRCLLLGGVLINRDW